MMNTKRIVFEVVGGILCVSIGLFGGSMLNSEGNTASQIVNYAPSFTSSEKIAVVNLDAGITKEQDTVYYARDIVKYPNENYQTTSLEEAKSGVKSGKFAAYIIIPSTFSASVDSINGTPKKAVFEYKIGSNLSSSAKEKLIYEITNFEKTVNTNVSYIFVDAILKEVHTLQDNASTIMKNDKTDTKSLLNVSAESLVQPIEFSKLKDKDDPITSVDLTSESNSMQNAVKDIQGAYDTALTSGQQAYTKLAGENKPVTEALGELETEVKAANPLQDCEGNSYTTAGISSLQNEVKASNAEIPLKREKLNGSITKEINQYALQNQTVLDTKKAEIQTGINSMVSNDLQGVVTQYLTTQNKTISESVAKQQSEINESIKNYTEDLQKYLNTSVTSNKAKTIIQKIAKNKAEEAVSALLDDYDAYAKNKAEITQICKYNDQITQLNGKIDAAKEKASTLEKQVEKAMESETLEEETKNALSESMKEFKGSMEGLQEEDKQELPEEKQKPDTSVEVDEDSIDLSKLGDLVKLKDAVKEEEDSKEDSKKEPVEQPNITITMPTLELKFTTNDVTYKVPEYKLPEVSVINEENLKTIETYYELPTDRFTTVIQKNLVDMIQTRNTELQKKAVEKLTVFSTKQKAYQENINAFDPFSYVDSSKIQTNTSSISTNMTNVMTKMNETSSSYLQYVTDTLSTANENIGTLQQDMSKANDQTKKNVVSQMEVLKKSRSNNNETNISLLKGFAGKLSFTRIGDLPHKEVYRFIINPVEYQPNDK